jgi:hypothetical protein
MALAAPAEAQVRADPTRQLRGYEGSCGHPECFHHTMYLDVAPQLSAVAGRSSSTRHRLPFQTQGPSNGVTRQGNDILRITIRERGDEPCYLQVTGTEGASIWNECGGNPGSTRSAGLGRVHSLVGIKICNNGRSGPRGRLVKGVELEWAIRPHEAYATDQVQQREKLVQPNCSRWREWVRCPTASAAQTLVVHHEAIGGRRAIVGLQLECYPTRPNCLVNNDPAWTTYDTPILACRSGDR